MRGIAEVCGCFPTGKHYAGIAHLIRIQAIGVVEGLDAEAPWIDLPVALIDVETTGKDAVTDRVVEIAIVIGRAGEIVERKTWLINPGRPIPDESREIHGISDEMVKDQPPFAQVAREIVAAMDGVVPAAYNASFDRAFLFAELDRAGIDVDTLPSSLKSSVEWIDPLVWARELHKFEKGKSLGEVAERLGLKLDNAHRATFDAEAALRVLYLFASDVRVPKTYARLTQEQRRLLRMQDEERNRWRAGRPPPS